MTQGNNAAKRPSWIMLTAILTALLVVVGGARLGAVAQEATPEATPDGQEVAAPQLQLSDDTAQIALVHASGDAGPVSVMIDGNEVATDVEFGQVSEFMGVDTGDRQIMVVPAGEEGGPGYEAELNFSGNNAYVVIVAGPAADLQVQSFEMLLDPVGDGNVRTRFIHAAPAFSAMDFAMQGAEEVEREETSYFNASSHRDLGPGELAIELRVHDQNQVVLEFPAVSAESGAVYEFILAQDENFQPVGIVVGAFGGIGEDDGVVDDGLDGDGMDTDGDGTIDDDTTDDGTGG